MVDITVIGDVNIDILTSPVKSYPKKDLQTVIPWINMEAGGGGSHFAITVSKLGMKTRLIGSVGNDIFGDILTKKFDKFKIENKIKKMNEEKTGISIGINFEDSSRSLLTYRGTNSIISLRDFDLREIEGKALFISGYNLMKGFQQDVNSVLKYAKVKNIITCLEPDLKSGIDCDIDELKSNLKLVDFFFPDFEEGKMLTREKDERRIARKILDFGCKNVVLKLGEKGCLIANRERIFSVKGKEANAINTTGAGDFFNAGFVFGFLKYGDLQKAGIFGNVTAAFAISRFGDYRYPSLEEVNRL